MATKRSTGPQPYYLLLMCDTRRGRWTQELGDFSRRVVEQERLDSSPPRWRWKVVKSPSASQPVINAVVAKLNDEGSCARLMAQHQRRAGETTHYRSF